MGIGKRKREALPEEVEVDITAPEPPSKKELRRAKKGKPINHKPANSDDEADPVAKAARKAASKIQAAHKELDRAFVEPDADGAESEDGGAEVDEDDDGSDEPAIKKPAESERHQAPGVWIGNLPWTVTKSDLIKFVTEQGKILPTDVTRLHLPGPTTSAAAASRHKKLSNRGFAYLDFKTEEARDIVIKLSESLLAGRAVLIKSSKSYEGRPAPDPKKLTEAANGKPPSARIFVGNLSFDTTEDDLRDHFAKCGQVKSAFVATFQDSGNCKGYAWITFDEVVSAEKAVRGWVELTPEEAASEDEDGGEEDREPAKESQKEDNDDDDNDEEVDAKPKTVSEARKERRKKKSKPRKWFVNRMKGRDLRMEFAEDATTRYQKRYGKGKPAGDVTAATDITPPKGFQAGPFERKQGKREDNDRKPKSGSEPDDKPRRERPAPPPRPVQLEASKDKAYLTGAVMEGKGKKITF